MQEQLISFETAKLLSNKKFDIFVPHTYMQEYENDPVIISSNMNLQAGWISTYFAPTQSLLQKWLREKHKIHIYVTPYENKEYDVAQKK